MTIGKSERTAEQRARQVIATRLYRQRNRAAGKCPCGRERRVRADGRPSKICETCAARTVVFSGVVVPTVRAAIPETRRSWVRLTIDCEAAALAEWQAFADGWGMPLAAVIGDAMELFIAATEAGERDV